MKEELLHFIWQSKKLQGEKLCTTEGEKIAVIKWGTYNYDAGPDFMNVRVKIGQTEWAGNIEMHLRSSEWLKHKHQHDKAYDNVVLHVVFHHDKEIVDRYGNSLPTLELKEYISPTLFRKYEYLQQQQNTIACEKIFSLPDETRTSHWLERLLIERLEQKCDYLNDLLIRTNGNWEQSFYVLTARYFGMKTNAQPFEWLAERLPLQVLAKHKNNAFQIEALVCGTAGLIDEMKEPDLKKEFLFLQGKYKIEPLQKHIWKFAQTRPANFPTVRTKQFAAFIHHSSHLFSKVVEADTLKKLEELYLVKNILTKNAAQLLLINSVLPALFLYGRKLNKPELCERALDFFQQLKPETNSTIQFWKTLDLPAAHAAHTQALLQLKTHYCNQLACLRCTFGQNILLNE